MGMALVLVYRTTFCKCLNLALCACLYTLQAPLTFCDFQIS